MLLTTRRTWREYARDPAAFLSDILAIKMHPKAEEICASVLDNHATVVKGCTESGKTFISAGLIHWWMCTDIDPIAITTAPSEDLVQNLIWRDYQDQYERCRWKLYERAPGLMAHTIGPKWYAMGKTARPENAAFFSGFHTRGKVLFVIDEGSGVEQIYYDARERIAASPECRTLVIGNPWPPGTEFQRCFRSADWHPVTIKAMDIPNVKERRNVIPGLLRHEAVDRWEKVYGRGSAFWITRVEAEFDESGDTSLIPIAWIEESFEGWKQLTRKLKDGTWQPSGHRTLGIDIADGGNAETIFAPLEGSYMHELEVYPIGDTTHIAHHAEGKYLNKKYHAVPDSNGVGSGVSSTLRHDGYSVTSYKGSEGTDETDKTGELTFANRRSAAYWRVREALDPRNPNRILLPPDQKLREDLGLRYKEVGRGKIQVEPKDGFVKRLGRSPDRGDAVAMAIYGSQRGGKFATTYPGKHSKDRNKSNDPLEEIFK